MKNIKNIAKVVVLILIINSLTVFTVGAVVPPPPPPGHGQSGNVPGGGAPVGSGLLILTVLGAAYGAKKMLHRSEKTKNY